MARMSCSATQPREFWDRKHLGRAEDNLKTGTQTPRSTTTTAGLTWLSEATMSSYRLCEPRAEEQEASRRIKEFRQSKKGSAFINDLVTRHYRGVMNLIKRGGKITMYDDGLVEIMFLYDDALEVVPSDIFITYAYLLWRERRKPATGPATTTGQRRTREGPPGQALGLAGFPVSFPARLRDRAAG